MRYITIIRGNSSVTGYKGKGIIIDDDKPIQLTDQADDNLIREYGLSLIDKFLNPEKNKMLRNLSDLCNVGIRSLQMMFSAVHNDLDSPINIILAGRAESGMGYRLTCGILKTRNAKSPFLLSPKILR
ncbi:hypothetical protein YC2023_115750 [Brassica napus]